MQTQSIPMCVTKDSINSGALRTWQQYFHSYFGCALHNFSFEFREEKCFFSLLAVVWSLGSFCAAFFYCFFFTVQWGITVAPTEVWRDSFICVGSVRCQAYFWGLKYRHLNWYIQCQPLTGALRDELQKTLLPVPFTLLVPTAVLPIPCNRSLHPRAVPAEGNVPPLIARGLCCT